MRSHVISAGVGGAASATSVSTSSADDQRPQPEAQPATPASYVLRENPKRSIKLTDPEYFSSSYLVPVDHGESSIVQDQDSDIESSPRADTRGGAAARRQRSKRQRRASPTPALDFELASSVSDGTPEEDVAASLIMLSRDTWKPKPDTEPISNADPDSGSNKTRTQFECSACKKVFRSFQALGGHRAGFKNGRVRCVGLWSEKPSRVQNGFESDSLIHGNVDGSKTGLHPCPFCPKVFRSGQALGGHKKSHLKSSHDIGNGNSSDAIVNSVPPSSSSSPVGFIDLNMPAPVDDEFEMSAVYDAEFDQIKMA
jgi:C2H2-type zinc finger